MRSNSVIFRELRRGSGAWELLKPGKPGSRLLVRGLCSASLGEQVGTGKDYALSIWRVKRR